MRTSISAAVLAGLASMACASATQKTTTDVAEMPMSQQITLGTQQSIRFNTTATTAAVGEDIGVGVDSAYTLMTKAYAEIGIPIAQMDPRSRSVVNPTLKLRRRLGGVSMVKYLDCGNKDNVPNAETYDLVLSIASAATVAEGGRSRISTRLSGVASHPVFGSANQTVCTTTGELEKRIAQVAKQKAGLP
ncbi:MAG: hypothetical protein FJ202_09765 [Gemmatimonadetes bacterium]|nr:hypothetical protein [Gemmatimonadota bacterium]